MKRLRAFFKRRLSRHMLLIEFCHSCGQRQPLVWTADDALWAEVVNPDGSGVLCPECFDHVCSARGLSLRWVPVVEG